MFFGECEWVVLGGWWEVGFVAVEVAFCPGLLVEWQDDDVVWVGEDDVAVFVEFEDEVMRSVAFGGGDG